MTVHLRSGDVFAQRPHPGYGQFPCNFYVKVIKKEKPQRIVVVAEDTFNPCFKAIREVAQDLEVPFESVGEDFESAVAAIASADRIVSSVGTFVPTLCFLFPRDREIFTFGRQAFDLYPDSKSSEYVFSDRSGEYVNTIMSFNWQNTESQIALMASYPESEIGDSQPASRNPKADSGASAQIGN